MKPLVVFYSRSGTTRIIAYALAKMLKCDIEEIVDAKNRYGIFGFFAGGRDAILHKHTIINNIRRDLRKHDLVIVGTPVWAGNITPAIRTFIARNKASLRKVAFFCTSSGSNNKKVLLKLEEISGHKPISSLSVRAQHAKDKDYVQLLKPFVKHLMHHTRKKALKQKKAKK